ncbi:MAG TPA: hypothetical protein VIE16_05965 [Phenylobacterium sp.]|jgi:hypothetical protein
MPRFQALVGKLNARLGKDEISNTIAAREAFAPGRPFHVALADMIAEPKTVEHRTFSAFVGRIPAGIQETLRSTIYHALGTSPPTLVTFAWAPSYDYEMTIWQAPDTAETLGGITVLIKSRYPDDRHPLAQAAS